MGTGQQPSFTPRLPGDAETAPAMTSLSSPGQQHPRRRGRFAMGLMLALTPIALCVFMPIPPQSESLPPSDSARTGNATRAADEDADARLAYAQATPNDVITRLQKRMDSRQITLAYDNKWGYLPAVLKALQVPLSSQMLVFSKTSVQKDMISPERPRALYFNEDVYIGYVPDSKAMEVVADDPRLGPVYYVLLQKPTDKPVFFRSVDACLECHATKASHYIPEHLMRSVYVDADGLPYPGAQSYATTDASPWNQRWGGWYVTGRHGVQRHMGNGFALKHGNEVTMDLEKGANITHLHGLVDTSPYLTPHSDIVALMVFAHQTHLQSLITQANYQTQAALRKAKAADAEAQRPEDAGHVLSQVKEICEPLVKAMLFEGEPPLKSPIFGTSGFAEQFAIRGPHDRKNRSLWELDLKHRLFRYPCSYTIYSQAFDALPDPAKDYLFRRLREVLSGRDRSKEFAYLSAADRKAILEILQETKPAFAARAARR